MSEYAWFYLRKLIGTIVAEWLATLTPNQQAVTNVGSKLICVRYWEPLLI